MITTESFRVDPIQGIVYGPRGRPVVKKINGYVYISTREGLNFSAHRLIWERVHGPIPHEMQINHINGVKNDNRICNLELVTQSQNAVHAYRIGLQSKLGEKNGRAKLTEADVLAIRQSEMSIRQLAELMGVSSTAISQAKSGRNWKHLPLVLTEATA